MFSWDGFSALRWLVLGLFSQQTMVLVLGIEKNGFLWWDFIFQQGEIRCLCDWFAIRNKGVSVVTLEKVLLFRFCNQFHLSVMKSVATYHKSYCFLRVSLHVTHTLANKNCNYLVGDYYIFVSVYRHRHCTNIVDAFISLGLFIWEWFLYSIQFWHFNLFLIENNKQWIHFNSKKFA